MNLVGKQTLRTNSVSLAAIFVGLNFATLFCAGAVRAQQLPPANRIARPQAYVSPAPVRRGSTFQVTVEIGILPGFHVNANKPSEDYLIPTVLAAKPPAGFKELATTYPPGVPKKLSFMNKPLLVYTGKFTVHAKFAAERNAPLGKVTLPFVLQYQACNDAVCLQPVRIPVDVTVNVSGAR